MEFHGERHKELKGYGVKALGIIDFAIMTDNMRVRVLGSGTSQGVPVVGCECRVCSSSDPYDKRLRASVLVETAETVIVIDAGPDFRQQMLRADVKKLDAVVITHPHKDHTGGLDDVRAFNWIQKKPMDIYGRDAVLESVRHEYPYAFGENKYPGVPDMRLHKISNAPFDIGDMHLIPIDALHYKMPVFGFRIGDFSYLTDANQISQEEFDKMRGSRVVIINALRKEKHISHFTLDEAVDMLNELKVEKGYITHVSHQMGLRKEVEPLLPDHIRLACDGLEIQL